MEESTNSDDLDFHQYRASQTNITPGNPPKSNFKTFSLLRKQENLISQFESNLQKTMDLLNKKPSDSMLEDPNYNSNSVPDQQIVESSNKDTLQFKIVTIEKENIALRTNVTNLERENEILKSTINTLILSKRTSDEDKTKDSPRKLHAMELRTKVDELTEENERLRQNIIKIKEDMFKRYEQLQKGNDELLMSYEERVHYIC